MTLAEFRFLWVLTLVGVFNLGVWVDKVSQRQRKPRNPEAGFGALLLEVLIACTVLLILAAMAVPSYQGVQRMENQQAARRQVQLVSSAFSTKYLCAANLNCSSAATDPLIPQNGTITTGGYNFVFSQTIGTPQQGFTTCALNNPTGGCYAAPFCYGSTVCSQNPLMTFTYYDVSGLPNWWSFVWTFAPPPVFTYQAAPTLPGVTATFSYFIDQTGVMRCAENAPVSASSPVCR